MDKAQIFSLLTIADVIENIDYSNEEVSEGIAYEENIDYSNEEVLEGIAYEEMAS